jgi:hypothetical protein
VTAFISVRSLSDFVVSRKLGSGSNGMVLQCRVNNNTAINAVDPDLVVAVKLLFNFGVDGAQLDQMNAAEYRWGAAAAGAAALCLCDWRLVVTCSCDW